MRLEIEAIQRNKTNYGIPGCSQSSRSESTREGLLGVRHGTMASTMAPRLRKPDSGQRMGCALF
jgi:hypothetical protein